MYYLHHEMKPKGLGLEDITDDILEAVRRGGYQYNKIGDEPKSYGHSINLQLRIRKSIPEDHKTKIYIEFEYSIPYQIKSKKKKIAKLIFPSKEEMEGIIENNHLKKDVSEYSEESFSMSKNRVMLEYSFTLPSYMQSGKKISEFYTNLLAMIYSHMLERYDTISKYHELTGKIKSKFQLKRLFRK